MSDHILQIPARLLQRQVLDREGGLARVFEVHAQVRAAGLAGCTHTHTHTHTQQQPRSAPALPFIARPTPDRRGGERRAAAAAGGSGSTRAPLPPPPPIMPAGMRSNVLCAATPASGSLLYFTILPAPFLKAVNTECVDKGDGCRTGRFAGRNPPCLPES